MPAQETKATVYRAALTGFGRFLGWEASNTCVFQHFVGSGMLFVPAPLPCILETFKQIDSYVYKHLHIYISMNLYVAFVV